MSSSELGSFEERQAAKLVDLAEEAFGSADRAGVAEYIRWFLDKSLKSLVEQKSVHSSVLLGRMAAIALRDPHTRAIADTAHAVMDSRITKPLIFSGTKAPDGSGLQGRFTRSGPAGLADSVGLMYRPVTVGPDRDLVGEPLHIFGRDFGIVPVPNSGPGVELAPLGVLEVRLLPDETREGIAQIAPEIGRGSRIDERNWVHLVDLLGPDVQL